MFALLLVLVVGRPPVADAQMVDGLVVSSSVIYSPAPERSLIEVAAEYTLTNVHPDETIDGAVRTFFFTTWVIAVPVETQSFTATAGGRHLDVSTERSPTNDMVDFVTVHLPFDLHYQESITINVTYVLPGGSPRSQSATTRVNDSYLSFAVWTSGDPGRSSVRVNIPDGFGIELQGDLDPLQRVIRDDSTFYEATALADPAGFFGRIYGRNDRGLLTAEAELPDGTATIRAWPDDPEWVAFVTTAIEQDVPVFEDLVGIDWPAGDIEVIETVTPYLYGYGGWFNASSGLIEIGDQLERGLILHELAHAWFNDSLVAGRWITEGLAEEYASQVIASTGASQPNPEPPRLDDPLLVPLSTWSNPWSIGQEVALEYELVHYNAAWWVIRTIVDDIGVDALGEVLVALEEEQLAYAGGGPSERVDANPQWFHFFDLLDLQAGASGLDELFGTYVLTETEATRLSERRDALVHYSRFTANSGAWGPPAVVRVEMSRWQFTSARSSMNRAQRVLTTRDDVDRLADELHMELTHRGEAAYESAETTAGLDIALVVEKRLLDDLERLSDDRAGLVVRADNLGVELHFDATDLNAARREVIDHRVALTSLTDLRARVSDRAHELGLREPRWPEATMDPTGFGAQIALAEARLVTLDALEQATVASGRSRPMVERIGLIGANFDGRLDAARSAFDADELDESLRIAATIETALASGQSTGQSRILISSATLIIAIWVGAWSLRRRLNR